MVFIFLGFIVSLILISCDGASDNGEENNNQDAEDRFNEVDEFPNAFLIRMINTDTEEDTLTEPDLFMGVSSARVHTQNEKELTPVSELNPQQVGDEQQSSLTYLEGDNEINLEDVNSIIFTVDPQYWNEKATKDDIVTKKIDLE